MSLSRTRDSDQRWHARSPQTENAAPETLSRDAGGLPSDAMRQPAQHRASGLGPGPPFARPAAGSCARNRPACACENGLVRLRIQAPCRLRLLGAAGEGVPLDGQGLRNLWKAPAVRPPHQPRAQRDQAALVSQPPACSSAGQRGRASHHSMHFVFAQRASPEGRLSSKLRFPVLRICPGAPARDGGRFSPQ